MQYYDINLATGVTQDVGAQGSYIYYTQGTTPLITAQTSSAAGNQAIKVQAGASGNTIILMPGQSIQLPDSEKVPNNWRVSNYKNLETITGQILVGDGEFHDSNIKSTVTLTSNSTIQTAQAPMAYTTAYSSNSASVALTAIQLLSAAANTSGAALNSYNFLGNGVTTSFSILAKATAPATLIDGDVIIAGFTPAGSTAQSSDISKMGLIKVPAGKAIWYISTAIDNLALRAALLTVY